MGYKERREYFADLLLFSVTSLFSVVERLKRSSLDSF